MNEDAERSESWQIPLLMAVVGAVAGLVFWFLVDDHGDRSDQIALWRQVSAAFVGIATLSFLITLDRRRWWWSVVFAIGWGTVMALVGWSTATYNREATLFEWPFLSGIGAVLVAAPLFQSARDEGAVRFPIVRIHHHVWTDVVIGGIAILFTGLSFAVANLIAALFNLLGIDQIQRLLQEGWFSVPLVGGAFGGAVGIMREREALLGTVRKLVMAVLAVLVPVVAAAIWGFFLVLPFTGLDKFWDSGVPPTPLLLAGAFGCFALINVIIGDGTEDRQPWKLMRYCTVTLAAAILPLAFLAALSLGQRIGQYGWTPERLWGVVAILITAALGVVNWYALAKGRLNFPDILRPLQVKVALGVVALALFLALPIVDFGSISANSQLARLQSGKIKVTDFDWAAMAFNFGPRGRASLSQIKAQSTNAEQRRLAADALGGTSRHEVKETVGAPPADADNIRVVGDDISLDEATLRAIGQRSSCDSRDRCVVVRLDERRLALVRQVVNSGYVMVMEISPGEKIEEERFDQPEMKGTDISNAPVEIRTVTRKQAFVDGKPVGDLFE